NLRRKVIVRRTCARDVIFVSIEADLHAPLRCSLSRAAVLTGTGLALCRRLGCWLGRACWLGRVATGKRRSPSRGAFHFLSHPSCCTLASSWLTNSSITLPKYRAVLSFHWSRPTDVSDASAKNARN